MQRMAIYDNETPPGCDRVIDVAYKCRLAYLHSPRQAAFLNGKESGNLSKVQTKVHQELFNKYEAEVKKTNRSLATQ